MVITNIKSLFPIVDNGVPFVAGREMGKMQTLENAWLLVKDGIIADFGKMETFAQIVNTDGEEIIDASGRLVMPAFCDSHTHIVYAGSREREFVDKIKGLSYEEIYKRGGGILNSVERLRAAGEDELCEDAMQRLLLAADFGTGAMEIKSGYGLSLESELKMLRVIARLKASSPLTIKATFLGAHAVPKEFKERQDEYVDYLICEMLPAVANEKLADFIDVFCDEGFFTVSQTSRILEAAAGYGLQPKIHANELAVSGGVQTGVKHNALSVDHLERIGQEEIEVLKAGGKRLTMPTVLPGAAFFLNLPLTPVREIIDAGLPVALASDCNPGSSPSSNMQLILSMGCIRYRMTPEEAIYATTINTAYAMGISATHGSITRGKKANLIITKPVPSYEYLPYAYGENKVERVVF
jgi:imidazolonepropionase